MAYAPTTNTSISSSLSHVNMVLYRKEALDRLTKKFLFGDVCMDDNLAKGNGRSVQWYRMNNLTGTNTTPKTEGAIGTTLSYSSNTIQATVSQYTDFITVSDLNIDTSPAPELQNAGDLLGYRAGLSVDTMTRMVIDAEQSAAAWTLSSPASYLRVSDIRGMRHTLEGSEIEPFEGGKYRMLVHPFVAYDMVNDPSVNGYADIVKHAMPQGSALFKTEVRGRVTEVADTEVITSTNVATPGSSVYRSYFFGKGGIGKVNLSGKSPSNIKDPNKQRFNINVVKAGTPSVADPEGVIGGFVSYNFAFVPVVLEGTANGGGTLRFKTAETKSSIG